VHMWEVGGGGLVVLLVEVRCGAVRCGGVGASEDEVFDRMRGAEIGVVGGGWCGRARDAVCLVGLGLKLSAALFFKKIFP
jgi:hypothetical protein